MPAQSQQQQKLFGLALAFKRGEVPASEVSDEIKDIADRMSEKEIEDFAATKHKGLPKMKEQLRKIVREIMRERAISELELSKDDMDKLHSDGEVEVDGEKVTYEEFNNLSEKEIKGKDAGNYVKRAPAGRTIEINGVIYTSLGKGKWKGPDGKKLNWIEISAMASALGNKKVVYKEGKKRFRQQDGIGKAKYTISYHDGKQKHKDGSDFFGIQIFKNKKDLETFRNALLKKGFVEESVNELSDKDIKKAEQIRKFMPGIVGDKFAKKASDEDILAFVDLHDKSAEIYNSKIKPIRDAQKKLYRKYKLTLKESINEGYSTEEKRIVMMAVRKLAKYRNVPLDYAINDLLGAGQELERDIKRGKITK